LRRRGRMLVMAEYRKGLLLVYSSSSISGMGKAWVLLRKTEALPLARQTASGSKVWSLELDQDGKLVSHGKLFSLKSVINKNDISYGD
jgi:hypothetical protein